jgi:hypothetical protein
MHQKRAQNILLKNDKTLRNGLASFIQWKKLTTEFNRATKEDITRIQCVLLFASSDVGKLFVEPLDLFAHRISELQLQEDARRRLNA